MTDSSGAAAATAPLSRRAMLAHSARACATAFAMLAVGGTPLGAIPALAGVTPRGPEHPDPRPGIDASHMVPPDKVREHPDAVAAFDEARTIPGILDGIRCHCGCADDPAMRSLITCYEGDVMALHCPICQGQARLAYRLHQRGRSLAQIRAAIDARYGD